jgi:hypothetical protein
MLADRLRLLTPMLKDTAGFIAPSAASSAKRAILNRE